MKVRRIVAAGVVVLFLAALGFVAFGPGMGSESYRSGKPSGGTGLAEAAQAAGYDTAWVESTLLALRDDPAVDPARSLIVIAGSYDRPQHDEAAFLESFLGAGGSVLVAEEGGLAGLLVAGLGATFERAPIVHAAGATPVEFQVGALTHFVSLPAPTPLLVEEGSAFVIDAWTAQDAFVDRDGDGSLGPADPRGPFPVAATMQVGGNGGRLYLVGSLAFMRSGAPDPTLAALLKDQIALAMDGRATVYIDDSHQPHGDPLAAGVAAVVRSTSESAAAAIWLTLAGVAGAALVLLGGRNARPWQPHAHHPGRFRLRSVLRAGGSTAPGAHDPEAHGERTVTWTLAGVVLGAIAALGLVVGLALRNVQAVQAGVVALGLLEAAVLATPPRLRATRVHSHEKTAEGQPVHVEVSVAPSRMAAFELRDGVPAEDEILEGSKLAAGIASRGQPLKLHYLVAPWTRGPHRFGPIRARASDALGLRLHDTAVDDGATLLVSPRREPMTALPLAIRRPEMLLGPHKVNRAGDGAEFHAIRDYQAGDAMRSVNWRASARSKGLMVTQRVLDSQTELTVLLDVRRIAEAGRSSHTPLTLAARAALTLAHAAYQVRNRVRFVAYGNGAHHLAPASRVEFLAQIEALLGGVAADGAGSFAGVVDDLLPALRPGRPVILLSGLEDDPTLGPGAMLLAGHGVPLVVVAYPLSTEEEPDAAKIISARAGHVQMLRQAGALIYEAHPGMPLQDLLRFGGTG